MDSSSMPQLRSLFPYFKVLKPLAALRRFGVRRKNWDVILFAIAHNYGRRKQMWRVGKQY